MAQFSLENKLFGGIYLQFRLVVELQYSVSPDVGLKPLDILNEARKQGLAFGSPTEAKNGLRNVVSFPPRSQDV